MHSKCTSAVQPLVRSRATDEGLTSDDRWMETHDSPVRDGVASVMRHAPSDDAAEHIREAIARVKHRDSVRRAESVSVVVLAGDSEANRPFRLLTLGVHGRDVCEEDGRDAGLKHSQEEAHGEKEAKVGRGRVQDEESAREG